MKIYYFFLAFLVSSLQAQDSPYSVKSLMFEDDFSNKTDSWVIEQTGDGETLIENGKLEIDGGGCTVWFKDILNGPLMIEYDAVLVQNGGENDHCRDLNCFWMAIAPKNPSNLFTGWRSNSETRAGVFGNYHELRTYYAGIGGHKNTTSRFRRYSGHGNRPLLPEHDLDGVKLIPNKTHKVRIVACNDIIQYFLDEELLIDFRDPQPYRTGWFGFRTVSNHLLIDNFKIFRLNPEEPDRLYTEEKYNNALELGLYKGLTEVCFRSGSRTYDKSLTNGTYPSERTIFTDLITKGQIWRMSNDPAIESNDYTDLPVWNANGSLMMFQTYRKGQKERWLMDANGEHLRPSPEFWKGEAAYWSNVEPEMVFFSSKENKNGTVHTKILEGNVLSGKVKTLLDIPKDLGDFMPPHPSENYFLFGDQMEASRQQTEVPTFAYTLTREGKLNTIEFERRWHRLRFTKSPDYRIFFNFDEPRTTFTSKPDGTDWQEIPFNGGHPDWMPGGSLLFFNAREELPDGTKNFDIRYDAVLPDGSGLRTLYPYGGHASACPDGKHLVCDGGEGAGSINYVSVNAKLTAQHLFENQTSRYDHTNNWHPNHHSTHPHPNSSPDGTKVLSNSDAMGQFTDIFVSIAHLPDPPRNLNAYVKGNKTYLNWEKPERSLETRFFNIYRSDESGIAYRFIARVPANKLNFTDPESTNSYYKITAIEYSGLEGSPSNEVFSKGFSKWKGKLRWFYEAEFGESDLPIEEKMEFNDVSNGYIMAARNNEKNGLLKFNCKLPEKGEYIIWVRLRNSGKLDVLVNNENYANLSGIEGTWIWQKTNIIQVNNTNLDIQLRFITGNEQVDKICLSNDLKFNPVGIIKTDEDAPGSIQNVRTSVFENNAVQVEWKASEDLDFNHYNVYAGRTKEFNCNQSHLIGSPVNPKLIDWGIPSGSEIFYKITSVDGSGNESAPSIATCCTTPWFSAVKISLKPSDASLLNAYMVKAAVGNDNEILSPMDPNGGFTFKIEIPVDGEYFIWGNVKNKEPYKQELSVSIDSTITLPWKINGLWGSWQWCPAGKSTNGSAETVFLKKGMYLVDFTSITGLTQISEIIFTNDPGFWPYSEMRSTGY